MKASAEPAKFPEKISLWLGLLLVVGPWLLGSKSILHFSGNGWITPTSSEIFELSFRALSNQRIVLSTHWLQPLLATYAFLGPTLLFIWYLIIRRSFSEVKYASVIALIPIAVFYSMGAPGLAPYQLIEWIFYSLLILPLVLPHSPLMLWMITGILVIIHLIFGGLGFLVMASIFSLGLSHFIDFLFAKKLALLYRQRRAPLLTLLEAVGFFALIASTLLITLSTGLTQEFQSTPPNQWWMAWILGFLCVGLGWLRPWDLQRWLAVAIFGHAVFFSSKATTPVLFCLVWISMMILASLPIYGPFLKLKESKTKTRVLGFVSLLALAGGMLWTVSQFKPRRSFDRGWVGMIDAVVSSPSRGFLVIGEAQAFLAHFSSARFIENLSMLQIYDENILIEKLKEQEIDTILVDKNYLLNYWKKWMADGHAPEMSNISVIARMISYDGKEIETQTLKLSPIKNFEILKSKTSKNFFILKLKADAATSTQKTK